MQVPSKHECFRLIYEMDMLEHIVAHSLQVCRVAVFLVDYLVAKSVCLNRDLVQAGALLHDITKTRSFQTRENHAKTGKQLLAELGYIEVGEIVGQHVLLDSYFEGDVPVESEIVNYADKRVLHDAIVSLDQRMDYILEKYGKSPEIRIRIQQLWKSSEALEQRIFNRLPFSPDQLCQLLDPVDFANELSDFQKVCIDLSKKGK